MALTGLANDYVDVGRYEDAVEVAQEGVSTCVTLAGRNQVTSTRELAMALCILGTSYSELSRQRGAPTRRRGSALAGVVGKLICCPSLRIRDCFQCIGHLLQPTRPR